MTKIDDLPAELDPKMLEGVEQTIERAMLSHGTHGLGMWEQGAIYTSLATARLALQLAIAMIRDSLED